MGTSFVAFRDRGFFLHDGHLELLLHLFANEVDRLEDAPPWLRDAQRHWRVQSVIGATGCVWAGLDDFLTSPDRVALVLGMAAKVRRAILERSTPFSEEKAISELGRPVSLMGDVPKTWVVQGVEALIKLLKNELRPDDGSLVLPKIEFCDSIAPKDPALKDVAELWLALERERFRPEPDETVFERLIQDPWTSSCPRVRRAWTALTAAQNLLALERWEAAVRSDRVAGAWARKALLDCRARQAP